MILENQLIYFINEMECKNNNTFYCIEKSQKLKSLNSNLSVEPTLREFPGGCLSIIYLDWSLFLGNGQLQ